MIKSLHYEYVIAYISQYAQTIGLSPELVYQFIDYAIRRVWKTALPTRLQDFRVSLTMNHGDRLPADWTQWAGACAYTDGGGVVRTFHYIHPEQIGPETTNTYGKALATYPAFYIEDMQFKTLPAGLTNITTWYFGMPPTFTGGAADSTDDGMPAWSAPYIHTGAAQALLEMTGEPEKSDEALVKRQRESLAANEELWGKLEAAMQRDVQQVVKQ